MSYDLDTLEQLRRKHPAWRLLQADYAPLVLAFVRQTFIEPNLRGISESELVARLEDMLYQVRQTRGDDAYPKSAADYLDDWASESRGWLRKYYPQGSDEPHFDLSPAAEKAVAWVESLQERSFVGTESRLRLVFDLLREIAQGHQEDPQARIAELQRQKATLDRQIQEIKAGRLDTMDQTAARERFQHLAGTARELLADFREVEQNFRSLDRSTRERIARREGGKSELLSQILDQRDSINDSDQGKSFQAFWDFLMSSQRQEELGTLLDTVFELPAIQALKPDRRLRRVHYDWLEAGEHTQRTVALLSRQLRRFLDDQVWLENRRIMEILHGVEASALALRDRQPSGPVMELEPFGADISLPMERPLYSPPLRSVIDSMLDQEDPDELDPAALFAQNPVDMARLRQRLHRCLQGKQQLSLADLLVQSPLEHGLAELVTWLQLASTDARASISDDSFETITWTGVDGRRRQASVPRIVFATSTTPGAEAP